MAAQQKRLFVNSNEDSSRVALRQSIGQQTVNRALDKRLREKIVNYDREATKLELRGQADAADVLRKAADKLRTIMRSEAAHPNDSA